MVDINEIKKECGSCGKKETDREADEFVKCQKCRYYFCSLACWGEGDDYYCQDCKNGSSIKYN